MKNNLFGFGCMRLPLLDKNDQTSVDFELTEKLFDEYLERGFTYFDTAYVYHGEKGESIVKKALVDRHERSGFELATKLPLWNLKTKEQMEEIFNKQLDNLGVKYVDYYLLHCLTKDNYKTAEELDAFEFIANKKKLGYAKHIGFSFHDTPELLDEILTKHGDAVDFVQLQINYLDWEAENVQSRRCLEVAKKHLKPVTVMEPCKGGKLVNISEDAVELLKECSPEKSIASWAFRFCLSQSGVARVLSGMNSMEQLEDNLNTIDNFEHLSEKENEVLNKVVELIQSKTAIACTGCSYCTKECPMNIAIPDYFELFNNSKAFPKAHDEQIARYKNTISKNGKPIDCIECGQCEDKCPQHLEIRSLLKQVSEQFDK
ncbi:MAG: aldo/keto reductase [Erysipelotrichaceae bacterium]|nr:aldo/keto reductase [Erysipelotrichaceae bacterium]